MNETIVIFGNGYVAKVVAKQLAILNWDIYITSRSIDITNNNSNHANIKIINCDDPILSTIIKNSVVLLNTAPPINNIIDPILAKYFNIIAQGNYNWVGYLSATSVYGDHKGAWVNESTVCRLGNAKAKTRLLAEQQWLDLYLQYKIPVHVLRLSGIYGPGRNCLEQIQQGRDFTIVKQDQYFSRIHIADICQAIIASLAQPTPGEIYNITDNEPAPLHVVQQYGAKILQQPQLQEVNFNVAEHSPAAKIFFSANKRVSNKKISNKLHIPWLYPNYRTGLRDGCLPYVL